MTDQIDLDDILDDSRMTFARLEAKFRAELEQKAVFNRKAAAVDYMTYINNTRAASEALHLNLISHEEIPLIFDDLNTVYAKYVGIRSYIDSFLIKSKIDYYSKINHKSFTLSGVEKEKLRHYVTQIKIALDESSLPTGKKEALFNKINDFLNELDRDRTTAQAYADLVIDFASTVGAFFREIEPAWKWFCKAADLIASKKDEGRKQLPPSNPHPQIEGPKNSLQAQDAGPQPPLKDEIPF